MKLDRPHNAPRWPKGPFPEKYRWDAVAARLDAAHAELEAAIEIARGLGLAPRDGWKDPYLAIHAPAPLLEVRRALAERAVLAFEWWGSERAGTGGERGIGIVANRDPILAAIAVGVAGPQHGIGTAAIVRFLAALPSFASIDVDGIGEDSIGIALMPRSDDAALRIAERVRQICPPIARAIDARALADRIVREQRLEIAYESR